MLFANVSVKVNQTAILTWSIYIKKKKGNRRKKQCFQGGQYNSSSCDVMQLKLWIQKFSVSLLHSTQLQLIY